MARLEAPPLDLRMNLGRGDSVLLEIPIQDGEWGMGSETHEAHVLGCEAPGRYIGELEDGSQVGFDADHVVDIRDDSPSLSGLFRKKRSVPQAPALPPSEERGVIYVGPTGVARFEDPPKKPGLVKSIVNAVKKAWSGPPTVREKATPIKFEEGETFLTPLSKKAGAVFERDVPGVLAPYVEEAEQVFAPIQPSPVPAQEAGEMEVWTDIIKPEEPVDVFEKVKPTGTRFTPFGAEESVQRQTIPVELLKEIRAWGRDVEVLKLPPRPVNQLFPKVEDVARGLLSFYEDLPRLIRETVLDPKWRTRVEADDYALDGWHTLGFYDGPPSPVQAIAAFLQIPWEIIEAEVLEELEPEIDPSTGETIVEFGEGDTSDIFIQEASELIIDAYNLLLPKDVPGRFIMKGDAGVYSYDFSVYFAEGHFCEDAAHFIYDPNEDFDWADQGECEERLIARASQQQPVKKKRSKRKKKSK